MSALGAEAIRRYAAEGFLSPLPALPAADAARHLAALEAIERQRAGRLPPALNAKAHLVVPFLWDLVHDARIVDPVAAILGPDVLCWGSSFFAKAPGSADHVPWHQDGTYWGLSEPAALTAWVAFTASDETNGCLRVVPGSHRERLPHERRNAPDSMLPVGEEVAAAVDEAEAVSCVLAPGEMSVHHVQLVHGSAPNRSAGARRVGFAIRYVAGHVRHASGSPGHATVVRGRNGGGFIPELPPEDLFAPAALARHRTILRTFSDLVAGEVREQDAGDRSARRPREASRRGG